MEPLKITFTTFLKICASTPRGMIRELRTFTSPGGYDFYKVMKRSIVGLASGAVNFTQALHDIEQIVQKPEREHTLEAVHKFQKWLDTQSLTWHAPPRAAYKSKSGLLMVRIEPELAFTDDGGITSVIHLWNLNKPELKKTLAGEGLQLMMSNVVGAHYEFGIFDLRKNTILGADVVSSNSLAVLESDLKVIERIWKDIHDPGLSIEDTINHISESKTPHPTALT
jgi:hypothetical protein